MNGKITSVRLIKGNNVIASKDINLNVEAGKSYDLSLRKSGLSNFVNGEYDLQVFLSNGIYRGIKVKINVLPISGIKITNKTGLELEVGNTLKLNTEITPSNHNSTDPTLTWTSSNNNIASVDGNGVVTGKKGGHVTISVKTKNNITASYELEVIKSITDLSVNRTKLYFDSDTPQNIWFFVSPSDTTFDKHVTWSSSDQEKVSIEYIDEENIRVKPLSSGIVTLTATTVNGISKNVEVQIKGLSVEPNKLKLELNNSYNLNGYVVEGYDNISYDVTYSSSNPSVATVDENGKVTAKKLGTTIITVTDKYNRTVTSEVEVIKIQASSFSVSSISTKTYNGKSIKPSVTVKYKGKTLKKDKIYTISYSNNKNPGKAKVKITAKKSNLYEGSKTVYFIIKPKKVTIKTPTTSSKTITVKYSKQTKVSGYEVSYRLKGSSSWTTVKASGASKKITGLKKGKTYQVRVRSYVMVDNKKYSGAWSKTKSIKCK